MHQIPIDQVHQTMLGAVSNGIFGTAKTEAQIVREEKYKQDLKRQMDEKRQRDVEEAARRRAEEERELAKHLEWQQQMEKQVTEEALRKQEKEEQERLHHQQLQEELEQRKRQDEGTSKRKPKRQEKPATPRSDEDNRQNSYDEPQPPPPPRTDAAYRSSSPPVPTLKNKDRKQKSTVGNARRPSYDDANQQPPPPAFANHDEYMQPAHDDADSRGKQTYRKPPTPRQPDITTERKKPPSTYRSRPRLNSNSGLPNRTGSAASLRSDGSDSEVLNRLEHLKRQLKDREARLQEHVNRHQTTEQTSKSSRKQSPGLVFNTARVHHRDSPTTNDVVRRILQTDDDIEYKPSYFRDDTILLGGAGGLNANSDNEFFSSLKRMNADNRKINDEIEREGNRSRYGHNQPKYYEQDDPTSMANYELNRIAKQNEQRLKKLRDLENDDASLLDSNEVLERFQQKQRLQRGGSQTTLQDDAWLK
ncbi:hypothetical protein I4U23_020551 [Adineta vaga]|nr:hypothetical protein I4U23_020551 [Adineta vaga]